MLPSGSIFSDNGAGFVFGEMAPRGGPIRRERIRTHEMRQEGEQQGSGESIEPPTGGFSEEEASFGL